MKPDLENDIRSLLGSESRGAPLVPHAPSDLHRRVRRRQVRTSVIAAVTSVLVIAAAVVAVGTLPDRKPSPPAGGPVADRTSTVFGVTITYPENWYLLQLGDTPRALGGDSPSHSVLQLTNFDPLHSGGTLVCPVNRSGSIPVGGVALYVQEDPTPRYPAINQSWPATLQAQNGRSALACFESGQFATWTANGRTYEAAAIGSGPAYDQIVSAFRSMAFTRLPSDYTRPWDPANNTVTGAYVVDSGTVGSLPWNLLAWTFTDVLVDRPCLTMQVGSSIGAARCSPDLTLPGKFGPALAWNGPPIGDRITTFGIVAPQTDSLEGWLHDGTTTTIPLTQLPASLHLPTRAFAFTSPAGLGGSLTPHSGGYSFTTPFASGTMPTTFHAGGLANTATVDGRTISTYLFPRGGSVEAVFVAGDPSTGRVVLDTLMSGGAQSGSLRISGFDGYSGYAPRGSSTGLVVGLADGPGTTSVRIDIGKRTTMIPAAQFFPLALPGLSAKAFATTISTPSNGFIQWNAPSLVQTIPLTFDASPSPTVGVVNGVPNTPEYRIAYQAGPNGYSLFAFGQGGQDCIRFDLASYHDVTGSTLCQSLHDLSNGQGFSTLDPGPPRVAGPGFAYGFAPIGSVRATATWTQGPNGPGSATDATLMSLPDVLPSRGTHVFLIPVTAYGTVTLTFTDSQGGTLSSTSFVLPGPGPTPTP